MKKINVSKTKGQWFDYDKDSDVKFNLRPFTVFTLTKLPSEQTLSPEDFWNIFNYSLLDWKGIVGDDDKALKCNEDNKKIVFEYDKEVVAFITGKITELRSGVIPEEEIKNLSKLPAGETLVSER